LSQNAQYCYSYVHNTNITVNILLFIIKQLTLCGKNDQAGGPETCF